MKINRLISCLKHLATVLLKKRQSVEKFSTPNSVKVGWHRAPSTEIAETKDTWLERCKHQISYAYDRRYCVQWDSLLLTNSVNKKTTDVVSLR